MKTEILEKQVIPNYQFGFRNSHSTSLQLARITDLIVTGFNKRESIVAVFLDIEKAFDTTWINGLIFKLIQIGLQISAPPIKIISTYLNNRKFFVSVDGFHSDHKTFKGESHRVQFSLHYYTMYIWQIFQLVNECIWLNSRRHLHILSISTQETTYSNHGFAGSIMKHATGLRIGISKLLPAKLRP